VLLGRSLQERAQKQLGVVIGHTVHWSAQAYYGPDRSIEQTRIVSTPDHQRTPRCSGSASAAAGTASARRRSGDGWREQHMRPILVTISSSMPWERAWDGRVASSKGDLQVDVAETPRSNGPAQQRLVLW